MNDVASPAYPSWYADQVLTAVQRRTGPLTQAEYGQVFGALFAAAATQAWADPDHFNADALAGVVVQARTGRCRVCGGTLAEPDLDFVEWPWLQCQAAATTAASGRRATVLAWAMWVGLPLVSAGVLSWVPSLVAALRHRGHGWGIATALLLLFTLSFWTQAGVETEIQMSLWLGSMLYGAFQVKPWLRQEKVRAGRKMRAGP